ncbi:MAG: ESX secretion-associated protein EspG [Mycobacterium sp.]|nr:ESX secretion-associated protein EspG [Mycobacterium sp.]
MGNSDFDQRHLIALYRRGLINELPLELGPMPVFELDGSVDLDLRRWNIVNEAGELTPPARELLAGLTNYEWALWGIVLLYNERRKIEVDLPEEFVRYGVQYALRDIPRVTFLIGYRDAVFTTITMTGGRLAIATDQARNTDPDRLNMTAGAIIKAILDPSDSWHPYPLERFSIPAATADALKQDRGKDLDDVVEATRDGLRDAGMAGTTVRTLSELLKQDNVALAQIALTRRGPEGKKTAKQNAAGVMFFTGEHTGSVVSYPTLGMDGRQWITYEPASPEALGRAVGELHTGLTYAAAADIVLK